MRKVDAVRFGLFFLAATLPLPAFEATARESPTFATYRRLPIRTAAKAVEPSSLNELDIVSKISPSVSRNVLPVFCKVTINNKNIRVAAFEKENR